MIPIGKAAATALDAARAGSAKGLSGFESAMTKLSGAFTAGLADCRIKALVVSHEAFGWLARAHGFTQHGISGISPEAEPSPARMAEIAQLVSEEGVSTIYFEPLVSDKAALAIASETGAKTAVLDPIEGATGGSDYPTIMNTNLDTLRSGQSCS
jgi:zinc transport system substrate-binding protein